VGATATPYRHGVSSAFDVVDVAARAAGPGPVATQVAGARPEGDAAATDPTMDVTRRRVTLRQRLLAFGIIGTVLTGIVVQSAISGLGQVEQANRAVARISAAQGYFQDGDMMHDALRADVYAAILVKSNLDPEAASEVQDELRAHVNEFRLDLKRERALHLPAPIEDALDDLARPLADYITESEQTAGLAFTYRAAAVDRLAGLEVAFENLADAQARVTSRMEAARSTAQRHLAGAQRAAEMKVVAASVLALAGLIVLVIMLMRLARPVAVLARSADRLGGGDFSVRVAQVGLREIDDVAAALNSTAARLGDLVARERAFSTNASHQLRTPVTALRLRLEHAADTGVPMESEAVASSLEILDHLESTVEHLLAVARDVPVERGALDAGRVVREVARMYEPHATAAGRAIIVREDAWLPDASASEAAVTQILTVLVSNALEHGAGTITIRTRDAGCGVALEVTDDGRGIDGPTERIFTRRPPTADGRGLGLSLARSLAEAEGGRLSLHHAGVHPTFTLMLPAREDPEG